MGQKKAKKPFPNTTKARSRYYYTTKAVRGIIKIVQSDCLIGSPIYDQVLSRTIPREPGQCWFGLQKL